jgi:hypothetical protein
MSKWKGTPYLAEAHWNVCYVLVTDTGIHVTHRLTRITSRFSPTDPYELVLVFEPDTPVQWETTPGSKLIRWDCYRCHDLRWLHGNPLPGTAGETTTLVFPDYDHPWAPAPNPWETT